MSHSDLTMLLTGLHSDDPCSDICVWGAVMELLAGSGVLA